MASAARFSPGEDLHDIATIQSSRPLGRNQLAVAGFVSPEPDLDPTFHSRVPEALSPYQLYLTVVPRRRGITCSHHLGSIQLPRETWPTIVSLRTRWTLLSGPHLSSLSDIGVLSQLPLPLCRVAALQARLYVPKLDPPSRINIHHVFLVCMRHHLDVLGHRECVIELPCWFGRGVVLNIWTHTYKSVSLPGSVALFSASSR